MSFSLSKPFLAGVFGLLIFQLSFAQDRALGTWKTHMPYGTSTGVFDAVDKVYSTASNTLFSYDKNNGAVQIYDKTNGLSDIGIKLAAYDPTAKVLVVAYNNSNLDFIYNGTDVYNIPDIKNKNTTSAIAINGISFYSGNAYISSDLGISVIDLARKEISNTYIIGSDGGQIRINSTTVDGTNIYAATDAGLKRASLASSNLQDYNNWILFNPTQHLPTKKATYVAAFNGKVYASMESVNSGTIFDTIFEYNGTTWSPVYSPTGTIVTSLNVVNGSLYFTVLDNGSGPGGKNGKIDQFGSLSVQNSQPVMRPRAWFESNGITWEADEWSGLVKITNGNAEHLSPNGPNSTDAYDIEIKNGVVYVAPGGATDIWEPIFNHAGYYYYKNDTWYNHNESNDPALTNFPGINGIASVPNTGKLYLASYLNGVVEYNMNDHSYQVYNKDDHVSPLEHTQNAGPDDTRIACATADKYDNVWFGNAGANRPIKVLKADHTWKDFSVPYSIAVIKKILIDQNDQLWMPLRYLGGGLLVWSYNQTLDDPSDDKYRLLNTGAGAGGLPSDNIFSIVEDKDGNIWVGTEQGIAVFYCPGSILTENGCEADQIKVERDGYIGYLFGTESVRALCVDAANRKWVGTSNGLWLISDDGKKELLKFTVDNSPLPSNQITDIAIDDRTGEVFIGTTAGLVSYQGDAIAECTDCDGALVYPNPVKPGYEGPIAIKGLTDNAYVKITDVSGTLVYQGKANGTQMIWDGKGYSGARAKAGVYLVFSSTDLGKERKVAKILLMN